MPRRPRLQRVIGRRARAVGRPPRELVCGHPPKLRRARDGSRDRDLLASPIASKTGPQHAKVGAKTLTRNSRCGGLSDDRARKRRFEVDVRSGSSWQANNRRQLRSRVPDPQEEPTKAWLPSSWGRYIERRCGRAGVRVHALVCGTPSGQAEEGHGGPLGPGRSRGTPQRPCSRETRGHADRGLAFGAVEDSGAPSCYRQMVRTTELVRAR